MSVLISTQTAMHYRNDGAVDSHGFRLDAPATLLGELMLNVQENTPSVEVSSTGKDHGPNDPHPYRKATAYLDIASNIQPGDMLLVDGQEWTVSSAIPVHDPTGGPLDNLTVQLQESTS